MLNNLISNPRQYETPKAPETNTKARARNSTSQQTIECRRTTQRRTKQLGHSAAGSLVEIHVPDVT